MSAFDIVGIGNAVVDVLSPVTHGFLSHEGLRPGSMQLVDAEKAAGLAARMPEGVVSSGGSVANTCAVAAMLGAQVAFLGKVATDAMGDAFAQAIRAAGVHYPTPPVANGAATARCLILVTPDGQRTMNTHLGASQHFGPEDIDLGLIEASSVVYLEGYLLDAPDAPAAFHAAALAARRRGGKVAISLSDAFCVERNRAAFHALLPLTDILFANEAEVASLYEANDFETAMARARADVTVAALTRSEQGSVILHGNETVTIAAEPARVIDSTGAGDCYAAGFLAGFTRGETLAECGRLATRAATLAIEQFGARPPAALLSGLSRRADA